MAYWMAYKNRKGNYKNYQCSNCYCAAPQDQKKRSIVTDACPRCGHKMSYIGILAETEVIKA